MLFWTYQSAHGTPKYPSFAAAYKADMAEYRHPSTPGYVYDTMPVMASAVRITARSSVKIGSIQVAFYDNSGDETSHRAQFAVNKSLAKGQSYAADGAWGLSDPETGDTNVASLRSRGLDAPQPELTSSDATQARTRRGCFRRGRFSRQHQVHQAVERRSK